MRALYLFVLLLTYFLPAKAKKTILCGHLDKPAGKEISLEYSANPIDFIERNKTYHTTTLDGKNDFYIEFDIDRPVEINVKNNSTWMFYNMYICPGDSLYMGFAEDHIEMTGKGEKHMAFMFEHAAKFLSNPEVNKEFNSSYVRLTAMPYAQYWKKRKEDQLAYMHEYFKDTIISPEFKNAFESEVIYDYTEHLAQYAWRRSEDHRFLFANEDYTRYLTDEKLNNPDALVSTRYVHFLRELCYGMHTSNIDRENNDDPVSKYYSANYTRLMDSIAKVYFTGEVYDIALYTILYEQVKDLGYVQGSPNFDEAYKKAEQYINELGKNFNNDTLQNRLKLKLLDYKIKDKPAPDFTAHDINGKEVKLSDFKGKVVYVDFWATTCVPCVQELPATKKLQEKYKDNKDVVFLYISFDIPQSRAEKFIKEKGFPGIHLFEPKGTSSEAGKAYNVSGIPRYILVDKNGNLVTANAPRPSTNPAELIDNALGKK